MKLFKRLQIRVKRARAAKRGEEPAPPVRISIREKDPYICSECHNRYESSHYFCPQCLGRIRTSGDKLYCLLLPAVNEARIDKIWQLIRNLSGEQDRDFRKALRKPSRLFGSSDGAVLQQWRDVLLAEQVEAVVNPDTQAERKRTPLSRDHTIFSSPASLPRFLSPATDEQVRLVAKSIQNAAIRLRWIEVVLLAARMIEQCYKRKPADRVVFSDYLIQMDQRLLETARDYPAYYSGRQEEFGKAIDSLKEKFVQMEADMQAVRQQVDSQL